MGPSWKQCRRNDRQQWDDGVRIKKEESERERVSEQEMAKNIRFFGGKTAGP